METYLFCGFLSVSELSIVRALFEFGCVEIDRWMCLFEARRRCIYKLLLTLFFNSV